MKPRIWPAVLVFLATAAAAQMAAPPVLLQHKNPTYTLEAQRQKVEGVVVLYAEIGPDGRAHKLRVIQPLGSGLDENAMAAVRQWRFRPGLQNGRPVTTVSTIEVAFHLHNAGLPRRGTRV